MKQVRKCGVSALGHLRDFDFAGGFSLKVGVQIGVRLRTCKSARAPIGINSVRECIRNRA